MKVTNPVNVVTVEQMRRLLPTTMEVRVPALAQIIEKRDPDTDSETATQLVLVFDARQEPIDSDWESTGGAMAADLPNPNSLGLVAGTLTANELNFEAPQLWREGQIKPKTGFSDPCIIATEEVIVVVHARSAEVGFFGSAGKEAAQTQLLHIDVARSFDAGKTWEYHTVTEQVYGEFAGIFATSGHGVAVDFPHGQTLVVPLVCRRADGVTQHMTMRSADRGLTWVTGQPVGEDMDETAYGMLAGKLVLSARRTSAYKSGQLGRFLAVSEDAGLTWSAPVWDDSLPAAACNAALISTSQGLVFAFPGEGREKGYLAIKRSLTQEWELLGQFTEGPCGYVEGIWTGDELVLAYEVPTGIEARRVSL